MVALLPAVSILATEPPSPADVGLTSDEALRRLKTSGPNAIADVAQHPVRRAVEKLWAPVPWMLEAAILLQLGLGDYVEASVVAFLLIFNAAIGFFQERRAQATLDALKSRLALAASVQRDGNWKMVPAATLVPGDLVKLSLGSVVAADVRPIHAHRRVTPDRGRNRSRNIRRCPCRARRSSSEAQRSRAPSRRPFDASCAILHYSMAP
jgi:magnesium-transporting ATPase (P-type)